MSTSAAQTRTSAWHAFSESLDSLKGASAQVTLVTCALLLFLFFATTAVAQTSAVSVEFSVLRDPINGAASPYLIPGAEVRYKITINGPNPNESDSSGYRTIVLTDNISDDLDLADTITTAAGTPELGCAANDLARLEIISADPARGGTVCVSTTTPGVTVVGSDGRAFGQNVSLNFTAIPGVLPATEGINEPGGVKGDLLPNEQVLVEFNAVLR